MAIKQISKNKWELDYALRDKSRQQYRMQKTVYGHYEQAIKEYDKLKQELYNKVYRGISAKTPSLTMEMMAEKYLEFIKEMGGNPQGIERNISYAVEFFGASTLVKDLQPFQLMEFRKWHRDRNPNLKPATINRSVAYLRAMVNKAVQYSWGNLLDSPFKNYPMVPEDRKPKGYITPQEAQLLIGNSNLELQDVIHCLIYTGCRISEILHLKWDHIDMEQRILEIRTKDSKRRGRALTKPISDHLLTVLKKRRSAGISLMSPYVFPKPDNPQEPRRSIKTAWANACKRAGLVGITPHILRHTFASWLIMSGEDIKTVSRLVGHTNIQITSDYYSHFSSDYLREKINKIGEILPLDDQTAESNIKPFKKACDL